MGQPTMRLWDARSLISIGEPLRLPPTWRIAWGESPDMIAVRTEPGAIQVFATDTMRPVGETISPQSDDTRGSTSARTAES